MKLLYWVQQFHPYVGGVEVLASHFLSALVERGHEPVVITSHGALDLPDEDEWRGVAIHRRPFPAALAGGRADEVMALVADVAGLKRRLAPDLVHVNVSDASPFFHLRTLTAHPSPSVVSLRVTVGGGGPTSLLADLLRSADAVTSVSAAALAAAVAVCPEIADRSRVVLNALPEPVLAEFGAPPAEPVLVGAGRLVADQGFDVAIRALAVEREEHPTAVLRLAGDGPARSGLEALADELGVADAVELRGAWRPPWPPTRSPRCATATISTGWARCRRRPPTRRVCRPRSIGACSRLSGARTRTWTWTRTRCAAGRWPMIGWVDRSVGSAPATSWSLS